MKRKHHQVDTFMLIVSDIHYDSQELSKPRDDFDDPLGIKECCYLPVTSTPMQPYL